MYRERRSRVTGATVWTSTSSGAGSVLPDGCMDLLWRSDTHELLVAGPDTAPQSVTHVPGVSWTGLRFSPGQAPALLGVPASALRDQRVPLSDLWGSSRVERLQEQVAREPAVGLEAIAAGTSPDAGLDLVTALLAGGRPVADVADEIGWGVRQLHRRSLAAFGYSPLVLGRVLRFRRALRGLRAGHSVARVAAVVGYADQAHLSREVRTFAGTTPSRLRPPGPARATDD